MNNQESTPASAYGSRILLIWLAVVLLFLIWLGWYVLAGVSPGTPSGVVDVDQEPLVVGQGEAGAVLGGLPLIGRSELPSPPFSAESEYVLAGAGLQGFYQNSAPDEVWSVSYPEPELHVQLIRRGPPAPQVLTAGVKVTWELAPRTGLRPAGRNLRESGGVGNATENAAPQADARSAPQAAPEGAIPRRGEMEAVEGSHFRVRIPVSAIRTDGKLDPYPVVTLRAVNAHTGQFLAETAVVLAVSPGFGCAHCHENAGSAILEVHDRHAGTGLRGRAEQGEVIACRSCHDGLSEAEDAQARQGRLRAGKGLSLSAAVHGWHAAYLAGTDADACMTCHVALGRLGDDAESRPKPMFARDFHTDRGVSCARCHGFMEDHALALLKAEREAGNEAAEKAMGAISPRSEPPEKINGRLPWEQQPDCASCHDFAGKPDQKTASAFNKWTERKDGTAALFSRRKDDMIMVRCITCHGAPHALYPAENPLAAGLDNIPPLQYQQQAAPLGAFGNCAACHGESKEFFAHHPLVERGETRIHTPEGLRKVMPRAVFSHEAHTTRIGCTTCHHTGHEDGKSMLCASSGCHDSLEINLPPDGNGEVKANPNFFFKAFHGPSIPGCMACHTESLAAGLPAGPRDCKGCHQAPSPLWSDGGRQGWD